MKVGQSSSFQKLISGKIEKNETSKNEAPKAKDASSGGVTQNLKSSVDANKQASISIRQVEKQVIEDPRAEVERQVLEASRSTVEDVERAADAVAEDIRDNPSKALDAQANQTSSKVSELLK